MRDAFYPDDQSSEEMIFSKAELIVFKNDPQQITRSAMNDLRIEHVNTFEKLPERFVTRGRQLQEYKSRFERGHQACVGMIANMPVHISWIAIKSLRVDEIKAEVSFGEDVCCIYDVETKNEYRGQGIYPVVIDYIIQWWLNSGGATIFIYIDRSNQSSIQGIRKSGMIEVGQMEAIFLFKSIVLVRKFSIPEFTCSV